MFPSNVPLLIAFLIPTGSGPWTAKFKGLKRLNLINDVDFTTVKVGFSNHCAIVGLIFPSNDNICVITFANSCGTSAGNSNTVNISFNSVDRVADRNVIHKAQTSQTNLFLAHQLKNSAAISQCDSVCFVVTRWSYFAVNPKVANFNHSQ
jgi:hypothetical protein